MGKIWKKLAVIASGGVIALVMSAAPASAATLPPSAIGTTIVYDAPTPYSEMEGGYWNNTSLAMHCWIDNTWSHGTNRWFLVGGFGFSPYSGLVEYLVGYVSANQVNHQIRVGHC